MKPRHKRLIFVVVGLAALGVTAALVLNAFKNNLVFYFSPSDLVAGKVPEGRSFRLGGLVETGSFERDPNGLTYRFVLTDNAESIKVVYTGILPDLFREGQGAIAQGKLEQDGVFAADEVLAKHDENYMPPEVAKSLQEVEDKKAAANPVSNTGGGAPP